ncbi:putative UDP-N-acetylenolpyruvoylglucosamine reductase-like [Cocos nucifera]|nr:putative UDP-N-acetylenolpyruvoylglucosamine reductase-like [Cocos nucifera]
MRRMALFSIPSSPLICPPTQANPNVSLRAKGPSLSFPHHQLLLPSNTTNTLSIKEELPLNSMLSVDGRQEEQSLIEQCVLRDQKHLKELSSWGIGGPCSYFLQVSRPSQLLAAIRYCRARSIPFLIVGKGSNCLFEDRGFDGFVLLNRLDQFQAIEPGVYRVGSGYPFNRLGVRCSIEGFSGLEFAGGIPGTVGGAVFMNAGAGGQETGDVIDSVEMVTMDGEIRVLRRSDMAFGYRWSTFQQMKDLAAIVAVTFRLVPAETTRERQRAFLESYCRARSIPFLIVGKGSNCLFEDRGFDGFVLLNRLDQFQAIEPGVYRVGSGYPFNRLGVRCSIEGFSGLEFAGGIPGTVGGAVFMNAGAGGQETGDVIDSVEMVTMDGEIRVLRRSDMAFGYRWSTFQQMKDLAAIVAVTFRLVPAETTRERQRAFLERRRKTQPIGERSAGSVFRNPLEIGMSAGELIELAGLKGLEIGGAKVSEVHANFFINFNGSTSADMLALINHVKERVDHMFGIELKEEIKYVPYKTQTI